MQDLAGIRIQFQRRRAQRQPSMIDDADLNLPSGLLPTNVLFVLGPHLRRAAGMGCTPQIEGRDAKPCPPPSSVFRVVWRLSLTGRRSIMPARAACLPPPVGARQLGSTDCCVPPRGLYLSVCTCCVGGHLCGFVWFVCGVCSFSRGVAWPCVGCALRAPGVLRARPLLRLDLLAIELAQHLALLGACLAGRARLGLLARLALGLGARLRVTGAYVRG